MEMDDLPDYEEKYYMNTQTKRERSERPTGGRESFCDVELQHNLSKVGYYHHRRDFGELSPPICRISSEMVMMMILWRKSNSFNNYRSTTLFQDNSSDVLGH